MGIAESLRQFGRNFFIPFIGSASKPDPERLFEEIRCELIRRKITVERLESFGCSAIQGNVDIFPFILISVQVGHFSGEITGCVYFSESKYFDLITGDEGLRRKTQQRYYAPSANPAEVARNLNHDALILGAALSTILKRQEIEEAGAI